MADGEINATDLTEETTSTLSGNEQFVMFDPVEGKRADIDEVAKYIAGDKSQLQTTEKNSLVGAINEVNGKAADLKEDIKDVTDVITESVSVSGTRIKIDGQAPFPITITGADEAETVYITSANLFDISIIPDRAGLLINSGTSLTVTQNSSGGVNCLKKFSELCPQVKVGDTIYLKADSTGTNKYISFSASGATPAFGSSFTVNSYIYDSYVYFYSSGNGTTAVISNIEVCFGESDEYEAYNTKTYAQGETTLDNNVNYIFGSAGSTLTVSYGINRFDIVDNQINNIIGLLGAPDTVSGELITINDAVSGDVISASGASIGEKVYVGSHNLFDISTIPDRAGYVVNNGDSLTITQSTSSAVSTITKLGDICPGLRVGDVATINATTTGIKQSYLSSGHTWAFGTRLTITQEMLDAYLYFYANGEGTTKTVSNIQIWFGKAVGDYEPFKTKSYILGTDTIKLDNGQNIIWSQNNNTLTITYNASAITSASNGVMNYSRWKGKNVLVLGDSISADNYLTYPSWASLMSDYFGMNMVNPSVHAVGYVCGVDTPTPNADSLINLLETLHTAYPNNDDFDLIIFFRGTNDYGNNIPIGTSGDSKTASFTGAVEWCFKYANENWSKARIVVFTPMQRITGQVSNSANAKLKDYADVIKDKANAIGFDVLDLFNESGFSVLYNPFGEYASGYNNFTYQYCLETPEHNPDGLHPNKLFTDTRLFPQISEFIKGI